MGSRFGLLILAATIWLGNAPAQVIEFESSGLTYQTLSREGLTIMFAQLPSEVRGYSILQVAVTNGSEEPRTIRPSDFVFVRDAGPFVRAATARNVVDSLIQKANRDDVIKLVAAYEMGLYGISRFRSTSGYELRRQAALAEVSSTRLKAAAAASAIALVPTELDPGESTDGAVFLPSTRPLGRGRLMVSAGDVGFEFEPMTFTP